MSLISQIRPVQLTSGSSSDLSVLRDFAEFWKIPYQTGPADNSQATMTTEVAGPRESAGVVIIAPRADSSEQVARALRLEHNVKKTRLSVRCGPGTDVSIDAEFNEFSGPTLQPVLTSEHTTILSRVEGTKIYLCGVDIVGEYSQRIFGGFEDHPTVRFRLVTKMPFSYKAVPQFLRDRSFRNPEGLSLLTPENLGPVEFLRTLFLAILVLAVGPVPRVKFWKNGKSFGLSVSHDVETARGLEQGASRLLSVEKELGLKSTWNVPSNRYPLSPNSLERLTVSGEIGGHDTTHDGRLLLVDMHRKVLRLRSCREALEELSGVRVRGFRAPLLQHNSQLAEAEMIAGYDYDSSIPSWEVLSPTSMKPHGVGTVFPFETHGLLEIPVSLPQDHQLIRVVGQDPASAVDSVLRISKWIKGIGGACVLLVHPDYEFAEDEYVSEYRRLLSQFTEDKTCQIMTLGEMADWWNLRRTARWDLSDGQASLISDMDGRDLSELETEFVVGFDENGFATRPMS